MGEYHRIPVFAASELRLSKVGKWRERFADYDRMSAREQEGKG